MTEPNAPREDDEDRGAVLREYRRVMYRYSFVGIELGVAVGLGFLLGRWLDSRFDTAPWLMFTFIALGLTAAGKDFVRVVKRAREVGKNSNAKTPRPKDAKS